MQLAVARNHQAVVTLLMKTLAMQSALPQAGQGVTIDLQVCLNTDVLLIVSMPMQTAMLRQYND